VIENIESTITTIGFPIAITIYLLWERQNTTKEMIKVLHELHLSICKLGERK
jgi:hypothetical protein